MFTAVGWTVYCFDSWTYLLFLGLSFLWFLLSASLGVYTTVLAGLSGGCRFGVLGTFRFIFQLLSFEVNFSVVVLIAGCYLLGFASMSVLSVYRLHVPLLLYS
jgi:NADH:ubiquinone oxidoreductase subunit H